MREYLLKLFNQSKTFQAFLDAYSTYYKTLNPNQQKELSAEFWKHIASITLPIIEFTNDGSALVYFLCRQQKANDKDLYIQGDFHGYGSTLSSQRLNRVGDTDVMCCITPMKKELKNALITYHFVEVPSQNKYRNKTASSFPNDYGIHDKKNWFSDPFSKHCKAFEKEESQFCVNAANDMTFWRGSNSDEWPLFNEVQKDPRLSHWVQKPDGSIVGGIASFENDRHSIQVFKPTHQVKKVVIVNDGFAYLLCDSVNRLREIAEQEKCTFIFISPLLGLGNQNDHPLGVRGLEYHRNIDQYCEFVLKKLLPELNKQGILPDPQPTNMTVIGASISGTAALKMGLTHPNQFSQVIAHSPAPIGRKMIDQIPNASERARSMRIDIECGQFENPENSQHDNLSYTQELGELLNVKVHIGLHGHQHEPWAADLSRSLPIMLKAAEHLSERAFANPQAAADSKDEGDEKTTFYKGSAIVKSPITRAGDIHQRLLQRIKPIIHKHPDAFKLFQDAIDEKDYVRALQRACTVTHEDSLELIKILYDYKSILTFDPNQRTGENNRNAFHHAAANGNTMAYDFINKQTPDAGLPDKSEKTASALLEEYEKKHAAVTQPTAKLTAK